jgi:hypothetical protein
MTAETSSHFVDALSRSPVHPVNVKANNSMAMILIRVVYPDFAPRCRAFSGATGPVSNLCPGVRRVVRPPN